MGILVMKPHSLDETAQLRAVFHRSVIAFQVAVLSA